MSFSCQLHELIKYYLRPAEWDVIATTLDLSQQQD
jgi:hypothetical protein